MSGLLIVDIEGELRSWLESSLRSAGYEVLVAANPAEALALATSAQPDVMLIGVQLEGLDGIEFARRLQADPALSRIALVHIAHHPVDSDTQAASFEVGANGCLELPIPLRELLARISHLAQRQQSSDALRHSEERQRQLIEQMADGVLVVSDDVHTQILFANSSVCRMFGRPAAELIGMQFGHALSADKPVEIELLRDDSDPRLVQMRATGFEWDGQPARLVSLHDISELRETTRKLLDRQQRYRSLFDHHPDAVVLIDIGGRIVEINAAFSLLTGWTQDEALQSRLEPTIAPEMATFTEAQLARAVSGEPVRHETVVLHRDGRRIRVEVTNLPMIVEGRVAGVYGIVHDISRRHAAETELLRSRALLAIAGRTANVGGWSFDVASGELIWSSDAARIHAVAPGFVPDLERVIAYYSLQSRQEFRAAFGRCARDGTTFDKELEVVTAGGDRRWVRSIGEAQRDSEGAIVRIQGAVQEISDRKAAEQAAHESLARFRLLAEASLDAIAEWNLLTGELWWSDGYERLFGRKPEITAPALDAWSRYIHPDDKERMLAVVQDFVTGEADTGSSEYRYQHADGRWLDVIARNRIVRDADGRPVRIVGGMTDVSEIRGTQRRLETQLARMQLLERITHAIGQRDDLDRIYRTVCDRLAVQMPAALVAVAEQGDDLRSLRIRHVAQASIELADKAELGEGTTHPGSECVARAMSGVLVHQTDVQNDDSPLHRRFADAGLFSMILAPLHAESHVFGVLVIAREAAGAFDSADCEFLRQLSAHVALAAHQAQLHQALQSAFDRLRITRQGVLQQERLRALGEMASGIAHDINNAVSPAALYTEALLETEQGLTVRGRERLEVVLRAIEDVARTVARMREFYRPRDETVLRQPVDLAQLTEQVIELTRARWRDMPQRAGIAIEVVRDYMPGLPKVAAVDAEVREALTNLVFNAVDAMPQGGTLTVRTRLDASSSDQPHVSVELSDTGIGMEPATVKQCMEPFFTTKGERGTGLGLAMVYGTMQRHQGEVEIVSQTGHGTQVRLHFPILEDVANPAPIVPQDTTRPRRLRLLVVDDDVLIRTSLSEMLSHDGHDVETAEGGAAAVDRLQSDGNGRRSFDLVMTDLGMPHVDGVQVARAAKAAGGIPVIMLTGWGLRMNEDGERPLHVDLIMAKPPRLADLRSALRELCPPSPS